MAAPAELDLDRLLGAGAIGGGLASEVEAAASAPLPTIPAMTNGMPLPAVSAPAAGNSPMFSLPNLSQQDLERCLEKADEQ